MKNVNIAILGATGAVGREMLKVLLERDFDPSRIRALAACMVLRRKIVLRSKLIRSAMGKANQTSVRLPVWASSQAAGISTTIWRHTEVIRLCTGLPMA